MDPFSLSSTHRQQGRYKNDVGAYGGAARRGEGQGNVAHPWARPAPAHIAEKEATKNKFI